MTFPRRLVTAFAALALLTTAAPAVATTPDPVPELDRQARPLRNTSPGGGQGDLAAFGRMVGGATVVGVGEATHSTHEFFTTKHRLFRYLVERKGFTTFTLETAWTTGLALDAYVLHGTGDPAEILRREDYVWATQEYVDLLRWMRSYNLSHRRKVRFAGNDIAYAGRQAFDPVLRHTARHDPRLHATYSWIHARLEPETTDVEAWRNAYLQLPLAERKAVAAAAHRAYLELRAGAWVTQHARVIDQTATLLAFDYTKPETEAPKAMLHRDRAMALNTAWWHRVTGAKSLLSAHNEHVAYVSADPVYYPKTQGAFLRDLLGDDYVNAGFTFHHGSFNGQREEGRWERFTVGAPAAGHNESTLDRVRYDDFLLDTRSVPGTWLRQARPTRSYGLNYPDSDPAVALAASYDLVIHLHQVSAARLLPPARTA